ncbi:MAG: hypothetical protein Kapaf2KO_08800 [Candidatus Kapaibacteriales bacterium]
MYILPDTSIVGLEQKSYTGYIVWDFAIPMAIGAVISGYLGYDFFKNSNLRFVAYFTTFLLALFSVKILFFDIIKPLY